MKKLRYLGKKILNIALVIFCIFLVICIPVCLIAPIVIAIKTGNPLNLLYMATVLVPVFFARMLYALHLRLELRLLSELLDLK